LYTDSGVATTYTISAALASATSWALTSRKSATALALIELMADSS
jgi:hypothetical protein